MNCLCYSVERLFYQLMKSGHPALAPLVITNEGILTVQEEEFGFPRILCSLLHGHRSVKKIVFKLNFDGKLFS